MNMIQLTNAANFSVRQLMNLSTNLHLQIQTGKLNDERAIKAELLAKGFALATTAQGQNADLAFSYDQSGSYFIHA